MLQEIFLKSCKQETRYVRPSVRKLAQDIIVNSYAETTNNDYYFDVNETIVINYRGFNQGTILNLADATE